MKKITKVGLMIILSSSILIANGNQMRIYDVKSGKVTYEIKGSGNIMGSTMQIVGKKRLIFDNYGANSLTEESKVQKQNIMGQTNVTKTHTITYLKDGIVYIVDFETKKITRMENMGMSALMGNKQFSKDMIKKMGGKKIGTDKVLNFSCDKWELMGTKQCIYKGIPLKVEANIMGIKNIEIATKAKFDISLSKDDFKLPDFPVYAMYGKKLEKDKLNSMDKQDSLKNKKIAQDMAELGALMATEAKNAGIQAGTQPTKAQEKAMQNAMMNAMFPQMKKEILSQDKALHFAKECFSSADTLQDAKKCEKKLDDMMGQESEPENKIEKWDKKRKKEILSEIEDALKAISCAKEAKNMQDMQQCE